MHGHGLTVHETNSAAAVPVCECGWLGAVHPASRYKKPNSDRIVTNRANALDAAGREHDAHLETVVHEDVERSDRALVSIGRAITAANETLQHRGRYGRS